MRPWQVVPGTGFVVDRFCNLPPQARPTRPLGFCGVLALPSSALPLPSLPSVLLCRAGRKCSHPPLCVINSTTAAQSPYRHWFLTHFHADHYKGLTGK